MEDGEYPGHPSQTEHAYTHQGDHHGGEGVAQPTDGVGGYVHSAVQELEAQHKVHSGYRLGDDLRLIRGVQGGQRRAEMVGQIAENQDTHQTVYLA